MGNILLDSTGGRWGGGGRIGGGVGWWVGGGCSEDGRGGGGQGGDWRRGRGSDFIYGELQFIQLLAPLCCQPAGICWVVSRLFINYLGEDINSYLATLIAHSSLVAPWFFFGFYFVAHYSSPLACFLHVTFLHRICTGTTP